MATAESHLLIKQSSLVAQAAALRTRCIRVTEYIHQISKRLEQVNRQIRALLPERERIQRLQAEALTVEERWSESDQLPPLFGVAVGIKDLFRVDGLSTRAGSRLAARLFAGPEATAVSMLRTSGAVILGKTAMDEFAYCEPPLTRNPHNLAHTPGGSSGGSAAAVAMGVCPLALGTQTSRSIIGPAAFCGVVGFKPSLGRIPIDGCHRDVALIGYRGIPHPGRAERNACCIGARSSLACIRAGPSPGARRAWRAFMTRTFEEGRLGVESHLAALLDAGYEVRRVDFLSDEELLEVDRNAMGLLHGEMARVHRVWFARYASRYRPRTARAVRLGETVGDSELAEFRRNQLRFRNRIAGLMDETGVDLWVTPASAGPAPRGYEQQGGRNDNRVVVC